MQHKIEINTFRNSEIIKYNPIFEMKTKSKYEQIIEKIKQIIFKDIYSNDSFEFRNMYYEVLEHFTNKYSNNIFSQKMLEKYKKILLEENVVKDKIGIEKIFKNKSLMEYKEVLLCDCLFINSFFEVDKAKVIVSEFEELCKYPQNFSELYTVLYEDKESAEKFNKLENYIKFWVKNKNFANQKEKRILITATMSAGKSTLINALVGKKISKVTNEACTEKIHFIYNKSFEDNYSYEFDGKLSLNATKKILFENNLENEKDEIIVSTYFRNINKKDSKICLIDTPGANTSLRKKDSIVTQKQIEKMDYDMLLYLFNAENISSTDNFNYLNYIFKNKRTDNIIFIINKLDSFRKGDDSIEETVQNVKKELEKIGFKNPKVFPISAYAGYLSKQKLFEEELNEDENDELELLCRKFKKSDWSLLKYYDHKSVGQNENKYMELLNNSGIGLLEEKIFE